MTEEILKELNRAKAKFPTWPDDPLHALAVLQEEVGELQKATLEACYEPHKSSVVDVKAEAIQTAAMALRFLESLPRYRFSPGPQHEQKQENGGCQPDCGHTPYEHNAFDGGMRAGRKFGIEAQNPYDENQEPAEWNAWEFGKSAGACEFNQQRKGGDQ